MLKYVYNCSVDESNIKMYSGLQSYYLVRWRAKPHVDVQCNITTDDGTYLFGIYSTVLLTQSVFVHGSIHMSLYMSVNALRSRAFQYVGKHIHLLYRYLNNYGAFQYAIGGSQVENKNDKRYWNMVHLHKLEITHFKQPSTKPSVKQTIIISLSTSNLSDLNLNEIRYTKGKTIFFKMVFSLYKNCR